IAVLRRLEVPLAEIKAIVALAPEEAAGRIEAHWAAVEEQHTLRAALVGTLVDRLRGREPTMLEVTTRAMPDREVLCLKRNVEGEAGAWALGKEFVALLRRGHPAVLLEGPIGAPYCIWWGEVSADSDGPLEWCLPVPEDRAATMAAEFPELTRRRERAHHEACVPLGAGPDEATRWQLVSESLRGWAEAHGVVPNELGMRLTYLMPVPPSEGGSGPYCEMAVPYDA
ncbi:MAG TPA: hypothetical protein VMB72_09165, partial [Acidimicrobiales bacterium]|nr:hypothetical protein [Acidimicrobiales bacterium]